MRWIIGILILAMLIVTGCTSQNTQSNVQEQPIQQIPADNKEDTPKMKITETSKVDPVRIEPDGITLLELKGHDNEDDCWVAYEGQVWDITDWLPQHPGSAGAIIPFCGTSEDFASAFAGQHGTKQDDRLFKEGVLKGDLI